MNTKQKLLAVTGLLVLSPAWLAAQTEVSPVLIDSRIRVTTHSAPGLESVGTFDSWDGSSLELSGANLAPQTIPLSDLAKLEISRGKKGHWGKGALIGTGLGLVAGIIAARIDQVEIDDSNWLFAGSEEQLEPISDAAIVFVSTVTGAALGGIIGALIKTERWEEVPLPTATPQEPPAVARY